MVDPEEIFRVLDARIANDVLFVFNSPGQLHDTYLETWKEHQKTNRNVQVLHLPENWSGETTMHSCKKPDPELPCFRPSLQLLQGFVDEPVRKLAMKLSRLADKTEEGDATTLKTAHKLLGKTNRRKPTIFSVLGVPEKHPLTRGDETLVEDSD